MNETNKTCIHCNGPMILKPAGIRKDGSTWKEFWACEAFCTKGKGFVPQSAPKSQGGGKFEATRTPRTSIQDQLVDMSLQMEELKELVEKIYGLVVRE